MNFRFPNLKDNYFNSRLFFQKDLRLPIESYGINDSEVTFEQVKQMAQDFMANKSNLLCRAEEAIMLGTLIGWAEQFVVQSLDAFIDCVRSHDFMNSAQLEKQFCVHLNFLSEIQLSYSRHPLAINKTRNNALSTHLIFRENSILEAALFSEKWRTNYEISKYLLSLSSYFHTVQTDPKYLNSNLAKIYSQLNTCLNQMLVTPNSTQLSFAHFLPEYFESPKIMENLFSVAFADEKYISKKINNKPKDFKSKNQSDFTFYQILSKYNVKEFSSSLLSEDLIQEYIQCKIGNIQEDDFEECMYFGLAVFLLYKNFIHGVSQKQCSMNQLQYFQQSAYFITEEGFNKRKDEFLGIILPNLLIDETFIATKESQDSKQFLTRINSVYNIIQEQIKKDRYQSTMIFPLVKQVHSIYEDEQKIREFDFTSPPPSELDHLEDPLTCQPMELAGHILGQILASIEHKCKVENDWSDILLLLPFLRFVKIKSFIKRICELIITIFEMEHPFEHDNDKNIQNDLNLKKVAYVFSFTNDKYFRMIQELKGFSTKMEFIDYIHFHSIQKNSPYDFSFIGNFTHWVVRSELSQTSESSLKLFEILSKVVHSDYSILVNEQIYSTISYPLYIIFSKFVASFPQRLEEACLIQIKSSVYLSELHSQGSHPIFKVSGLKVLEYWNKMNAELMDIQQEDKSVLLNLLEKYPSQKYGLTRSLSYFLGTKSSYLHESQFQFIAGYLQFLTNYSKEQDKPTKDEFKSLFENSISISHPFMQFKLETQFYINEYSWGRNNILKAPVGNDQESLQNMNNTINALIELFIEFIEKYQSALKRVIMLYDHKTELQNNPGYITISRASLITNEQIFDDFTLFTSFQKYLQLSKLSIIYLQRDLHDVPILNNENLKKLMIQIMSLYDYRSLSKIFSQNSIRQFETVRRFEEFERILKQFKKCKTNTFYQIQDKIETKYSVFINAREVPFWYFASLSEAFFLINKKPEQLNHFVTHFLKENKFRRDLQPSLESFFEHHAFYGFFYKFIFKGYDESAYQGNHLSSVPLPTAPEYEPSYYESGLFYLENLDDVLIELNFFTQFLIDLVEKENINQTFIVESDVPTDKISMKREVLMRFVSRFLKKSESHTNKLLMLAYSKNEKYQRSPQTLDLLNQFICNRIILHSLRIGSGRKISIRLENISSFLTSVKSSIDQFHSIHLEITPILLDVPNLYEQFGKLLALMIEKVIGKYGFQYSMMKVVEAIIGIDVKINQIAESAIQETEKLAQKSSQEKYLSSETEHNQNQSNLQEIELKSEQNQEQELKQAESEENKSNEQELGNSINSEEDSNSTIGEVSFKTLAYFATAKFISKFLLNFIRKSELKLKVKGHFIIEDLEKIIAHVIKPSKSKYFSELNKFLESGFNHGLDVETINLKSIEDIIRSLKDLVYQLLNKIEDDELTKIIQQNKIVNEKEGFSCLIIHQSFESLFDFQEKCLKDFSSNFETILPVSMLNLSLIEAVGLFQKQKWTQQQKQKQFDHCLSILESQCEIMNRFSSSVKYAFRKKSVYVTVFNEIIKLNLQMMKGLNNLVDDTRLDRMEALFSQLLEVKFIKKLKCEPVQSDILYFINQIFIQRGYSQSKQVLRNQIAKIILELATEKKIQKKQESQHSLEQAQVDPTEMIGDEDKIDSHSGNTDNQNKSIDEQKEIENNNKVEEEREVKKEEENPPEKSNNQTTEAPEIQGNEQVFKSDDKAGNEGGATIEEVNQSKSKDASSNLSDSKLIGQKSENPESENENDEYEPDLDLDFDLNLDFDFDLGLELDDLFDISDFEGKKLDQSSDEKESAIDNSDIKDLLSQSGCEQIDNANSKLSVDDLNTFEITLAEIKSHIISKCHIEYAGHSCIILDIINEFIVKKEMSTPSQCDSDDIYKLRDPSRLLEISVKESAFILISEGQFKLIQTLANSYVNKVFSIKENSLRNSIKVEIFNDYISLKDVHAYLFVLIKNHENLIIPQFGRLIVEKAERFVGNDTFVFYNGNNFFEFLIHAQLTTNYYSQDIISAVIFTKTSDEVSQQLISTTMKRVLTILEKMFTEPQLLKHFDMGLTVDGIQNLFKNLLSKLKIQSIEEGQCYLSIFERIISRAEVAIDIKQLYELEIISNYGLIMKQINNLIFGENYSQQQHKFGKIFLKSFEHRSQSLEKEEKIQIQNKLTINSSEDIFSSINWKFTTSQASLIEAQSETCFSEEIRKATNSFQQSIQLKMSEQTFEHNDIAVFQGYCRTFSQNLSEFTPSSQFINLQKLKDLKQIMDGQKTIDSQHNYLLEKQSSFTQVLIVPSEENTDNLNKVENQTDDLGEMNLDIQTEQKNPIFLEFPKYLPSKKKENKANRSNQSIESNEEEIEEEELIGTAIGYVNPSKFDFNETDIETFGIDINEYNKTTNDEKKAFLEKAKRLYNAKQEAKIKKEIFKFRESILLQKRNNQIKSQELEEEEEQNLINKQKADFKELLESEEFENIFSSLPEQSQALILQSNESDFTDYMTESLKRQSKDFVKQMELTKKQEKEKKKVKEIERKKDEDKTYSCLQKIYKKFLSATPPKLTKKENRKQDDKINVQSILQIPLLSEDVALRVIIIFILSGEKEVKNDQLNIIADCVLNPVTYIRVLGLVLVIAKAIQSRNLTGIKWVDDLILADKVTFLFRKSPDKVWKVDYINSIDKLFMFANCLELVEYLLFKIGYGAILLSLEEFIFEKEIAELTTSYDNSKRICESNLQFISLNFLKREHLNIEVSTYQNLNFSVGYPSIKHLLKNGFYQNIEEYIQDMLNEVGEKKETLKQLIRDQKKQPLQILSILNERIVEANPLFQDDNSELSNNSIPIIAFKSEKILLNRSNLKFELMKQTNSNMISQIMNGYQIQFTSFKDKFEINLLMSHHLKKNDSFADFTRKAIQEQNEEALEALTILIKIFLKLEENEKIKNQTLSKQENEEQGGVSSTRQFLENFSNILKIFDRLFERQSELLKFHFSSIFPRMAKHLPNHYVQVKLNGEKIARNWWDERMNEESEQLLIEMREFWLGESALLTEICEKFFEFLKINLRLNKTLNNTQYDYFKQMSSGIYLYHHFSSHLIDPSSANAPSQDEITLNPNIKYAEMKNSFKMPLLQPVVLSDSIYPNKIENSGGYSSATSTNLIKYQKFVDLGQFIMNEFQSIICQLFQLNPNEQILIEITNLLLTKPKTMTIIEKKEFLKKSALQESLSRQNASRDFEEYNIEVTRGQYWDSLLRTIQSSNAKDMTVNPFFITFKDENGYDAGGLSREFYVEVTREFMDPNKGFFSLSKNRVSMQPNRLSCLIPNHLLHFQYFGRLLAKSFVEGFTPSVDLTRSFVKHIVGEQVTLSDLQDIDPELERNLQWMLKNDVSGLNQDFTYCHNEFGEMITINLIPEGSSVSVTESNKSEYVRLVAEYIMTGQFELQIKAFLQGFYEIIPFFLIQYLNAEELSEQLAGTRSFDVKNLQQFWKLNRYSEDSPVIKWLLEILEGYTDKQRSNFLYFLSGQTRAPAGGFEFLQVSIEPTQDQDQLPLSHTCAIRLELPTYSSKEILQQKLEQAIEEGSMSFYIG